MTAPYDIPALKALLADAYRIGFESTSDDYNAEVLVGYDLEASQSEDASKWRDNRAEHLALYGPDDAALIAAARTALPGLVERVERLRDALEAVAAWDTAISGDWNARWPQWSHLSSLEDIARAALKGDQA